jgi:hypothetical protein
MDMTLCTSLGSINISWNDASLDDILYPLFAPWQGIDPSPIHSIEIQNEESEYLLVTPNGDVSCQTIGDLFANLEYTLTELFQSIFKDDFLVHASCIDNHGAGALFVGNHGSGKTTLALTAISSGLKALTDDVAILKKGSAQVVGFPRPFKVATDIWNISPPVVPADCTYFQCFDDLYYVHFYQPEKHFSKSTRLKHVLFSVRGDNGPTSIRELGETEALRRLLPQGFNFYMRKETVIGEAIELLRAAPPLEICYSDHWDAIARVKDLL